MAIVHILINKYLCVHWKWPMCPMKMKILSIFLWFVNLGVHEKKWWNSLLSWESQRALPALWSPTKVRKPILAQSYFQTYSTDISQVGTNAFVPYRQQAFGILLFVTWILLVAKYFKWHPWRQCPLSGIFGYQMLGLSKTKHLMTIISFSF